MPPSHNKTYCFIDTSVFVGRKFHTYSGDFLAIAERAKAGWTNLLTTDITDAEIKNNLSSEINRLKDKLTSIHKETVLISAIPETISDTIAHQASLLATTDSSKAIDNFFSSCSATHLRTDNIDIEKVMSDYFESKPPFAGGKKKCEFPDAFMCNLLEIFHNDNGVDIHIVSRDGGFKDFCDLHNWAHHYFKLSDYLEANPVDQTSGQSRTKEFVDSHWDDFTKILHHSFLKSRIYYSNKDLVFSYHYQPRTTMHDIQMSKIKDINVEDTGDGLYFVRTKVRIQGTGTVVGKRPFPGDPTPWHAASSEYQEIEADLLVDEIVTVNFIVENSDVVNEKPMAYSIECFFEGEYDEIPVNRTITNIRVLS